MVENKHFYKEMKQYNYANEITNYVEGMKEGKNWCRSPEW